MGTTVATNALLERKGEQHAMLIVRFYPLSLLLPSSDFALLTDQGLQGLDHHRQPNSSSSLRAYAPFLLSCTLSELTFFPSSVAIKKPDVLYKKVVEVDERVVVQWPELSQVEGESLVTGLSGEMVRILEPLNEASVTQSLQELYAEGYRAIGICFAHSYTFPDHERRVAAIAREMGFEHVSVSSELQQMIRFVSRANSTVRPSLPSSSHTLLTPFSRRVPTPTSLPKSVATFPDSPRASRVTLKTVLARSRS